MKIHSIIVTSLLTMNALTGFAQHHQHEHQKTDTINTGHHEMIKHDSSMRHMPPMSHAFSLNLPMNRNGSGTAWLPDAVPIYGAMIHSRKWMYMLHWNIAPRYTIQNIGKENVRRGKAFSAPNWLMFMGQRKLGEKGLLRFNTMLSADRITESGAGYPLLFQTGESWQGRPLVDSQHPHDLFSELSIGYTYAFSKKSDLSFYLAYPGEPALGSVAFMHRPSALANPDAPLSHHWNDGTHITFGVATIGYRFNNLKFEASSFTGREPDENRYNFDKPRFDSYSGRISYNPTSNWSFQVSQGWIKSPELLHADEDVTRTTASAIYAKNFGKEKFLTITTLWGINQQKESKSENAVLIEASLRHQKLALYTRYEWTQKSVKELDLNEIDFSTNTLFPINAFTLGFNYDLFSFKKIRFASGSQFTLYYADKRLNELYGKNPVSGQVFLRIYPSLMKMNI
ncbi:hypothetical protein [Emticicia sp. BO119]|uniref:hypothetical protein n=1 Tax=Emticicia sp. BO119 TaxID=2757768 RepID=UPI0015F0F5F5|nr:hypothetical protein [Emticicia sp. BO119]MBA4853430.1 hypothetical protein [Emticicia sp. BO119]